MFKKIGPLVLIFGLLSAGEVCSSEQADDSHALEEIFRSVRFEPQPERIVYRKLIKGDGPIEIRFRDAKHLMSIMEETPRIDCKKLYFVHDPEAEAGVKLSYLGDNVQRGKFIHVVAQQPLLITGTLATVDCVVFPRGSDKKKLNILSGKSISCGDLTEYKDAVSVVRHLESFDYNLLALRTNDARNLLAWAAKSRERSHDMHPPFEDVCPKAFMCWNGDLQIIEADYIDTSDSDLLCIGSSLRGLEDLIGKLPCTSSAILLVDSEMKADGIYTEGPLRVAREFRLSCSGDLAISGQFLLPNHGISFATQGNFWGISVRLKVKENISVTSDRNLSLSSLMRGTPQKPENMSDGMWQNLYNYWKENGFLV